MSWLEILVVIGVIGFVIYQQVAGQAVAGRRRPSSPSSVSSTCTVPSTCTRRTSCG
jgi:hypothetical protein